MEEYSCDYRVYTKKIYIISGKVKRFKVQLLRSNALFLCRHEDTSSLRLFSDERSGRQIEGCPIHTNGVGSTFWCRRPVKRKSGRGVCGSKVTGSCYLKQGLRNFLKMSSS